MVKRPSLSSCPSVFVTRSCHEHTQHATLIRQNHDSHSVQQQQWNDDHVKQYRSSNRTSSNLERTSKMMGKYRDQRHLRVYRKVPALLAAHPHRETMHRSLDAGRRRRRQMEVHAVESGRSVCHGRCDSEPVDLETVTTPGRTS